MHAPEPRGIPPRDLEPRYAQQAIKEDDWHAYGDREKERVIRASLQGVSATSRLLLNAGSGVHPRPYPGWEDVSVDLFVEPLRRHARPVCADLRDMPFATGAFGAVVCVGEVLGYCDPVKVLGEFARILEPGGRLIVDFGNTGSLRHIFTPSYKRAADLVVVEYNGSPERIWNYDPDYIESVLVSLQFRPPQRHGFYGWSVLFNRLGLAGRTSVAVERLLSLVPFSSRWSDLIMLVCDRA